MANMDITRV